MRIFDDSGQPVYQDYSPGTPLPPGYSVKPFFPGYEYKFGKSTYRGEEVGEGGYVFAIPGIYWQVALLDIASMHPHSIIAEELFGKTFTEVFETLVNARVYIKHEEWDMVRSVLGGKLSPYVDKVIAGEFTSDDLAAALKTAINSVYGLTSAKFDNPFRDIRNVDNIVAKRGALFMINLKYKVQEWGFTVAHIKTDSIKIPNATPEIIQKVMDYGKEYGYTFEHEATYDRMCLVNDAVYIARYASTEFCEKTYGYSPKENRKHPGDWTATGTQFQVPYVFKSLFSKEPVTFDDLCETKSVTSAIYLDMNERLNPGEHMFQFIGKVGSFCPMIDGAGGGELYREAVNKKTGEKTYAAVGGTKGWRWMESEMVRNLKKEDAINRDYYRRLADEAVEAVEKYGSFDYFVNAPLCTELTDDKPPWIE